MIQQRQSPSPSPFASASQHLSSIGNTTEAPQSTEHTPSPQDLNDLVRDILQFSPGLADVLSAGIHPAQN